MSSKKTLGPEEIRVRVLKEVFRLGIGFTSAPYKKTLDSIASEAVNNIVSNKNYYDHILHLFQDFPEIDEILSTIKLYEADERFHCILRCFGEIAFINGDPDPIKGISDLIKVYRGEYLENLLEAIENITLCGGSSPKIMASLNKLNEIAVKFDGKKYTFERSCPYPSDHDENEYYDSRNLLDEIFHCISRIADIRLAYYGENSLIDAFHASAELTLLAYPKHKEMFTTPVRGKHYRLGEKENYIVKMLKGLCNIYSETKNPKTVVNIIKMHEELLKNGDRKEVLSAYDLIRYTCSYDRFRCRCSVPAEKLTLNHTHNQIF